MKIRQLPDRLANKIAAGEVVERPASVVKELIENSIDANSKMIKVELEEAGLTKIKVTDDGEGMAPSDIKRAFLRHATSKIQYDTDLFHIKTLGFRGEALPSIASVSKLTIKSSEGSNAGTELYLEAGIVQKETIADARRGTEITVTDIFFNTPARLKYMKSIHTELSHITDLINRYALAQPHIRFELYHKGKNIFTSAGNGNMLQVIGQIYGMQVAKNMYEVREETVDFIVEGYIAKPEITRSSRNYITLIINGRYVRSHPLTYAIMRAYDTLLPRHRYPVVVLSIRLDPILVDVNVHPTKLEVRLSKEQELISILEQMIQQQFRKVTLIPEVRQTKKHKEKTEQTAFTFEQETRNTIENNKESMEINNNHFTHSEEKLSEHVSDINVPNLTYSLNNITTKEVSAVTNLAEEENRTVETSENVERMPMLYPIGQLQGTYILAQNELGFYMIDQHAAQERIKYELFKEKLGKPVQHLQQLLIPMTLDFTMDESILINENISELEKVGLYLESFGNQTYIIRSFPNWFPEGLEETIVRDMISHVIENGNVNIEKIREELAILMSCKQSIKANHFLNENEMTRLLHDLSKTRDPFTCPHGRPVIIHFSTYEIEKMFKRIM